MIKKSIALVLIGLKIYHAHALHAPPVEKCTKRPAESDTTEHISKRFRADAHENEAIQDLLVRAASDEQLECDQHFYAIFGPQPFTGEGDCHTTASSSSTEPLVQQATRDDSCMCRVAQCKRLKPLRDRQALVQHEMAQHNACSWCLDADGNPMIYSSKQEVAEHINRQHCPVYTCECSKLITMSRAVLQQHQAASCVLRRPAVEKKERNLCLGLPEKKLTVCMIAGCRQTESPKKARALIGHIIKKHHACPWCADADEYPTVFDSRQKLIEHIKQEDHPVLCCECKTFVTIDQTEYLRHLAICPYHPIETH